MLFRYLNTIIEATIATWKGPAPAMSNAVHVEQRKAFSDSSAQFEKQYAMQKQSLHRAAQEFAATRRAVKKEGIVWKSPEQQEYFESLKDFTPGKDFESLKAPNVQMQVIAFEESGVVITADKGDITQFTGDAIVNAANEELSAGGGVCGAIFKASDYEALKRVCNEIGHCPTGEARFTSSFGMPAPWIIHAVGPIWEGGLGNEAALLEGAYRNALVQAHKVGARSIAFPAISTGIYGYPLQEATDIAVKTIAAYAKTNPDHFDTIKVLCFDDKTLQAYADSVAARVFDVLIPSSTSYSSIGEFN